MKRKPTIQVATKCRYADRYKATRPPTCGCDICRIKFALAESQRRIDALSADSHHHIDPVLGH